MRPKIPRCLFIREGASPGEHIPPAQYLPLHPKSRRQGLLPFDFSQHLSAGLCVGTHNVIADTFLLCSCRTGGRPIYLPALFLHSRMSALPVLVFVVRSLLCAFCIFPQLFRYNVREIPLDILPFLFRDTD